MIKVLFGFWLWSLAIYVNGDLPCVFKDYGHNHRVCVCNSTYCDTVGRVSNLKNGEFLAIISSMEGLRFNKTKGKLIMHRSQSNHPSHLLSESETPLKFFVNISHKYQKIVGYGGAFTDAAGINIKSLGVKTQRNLLRSYFSKDGIEYNLCRVPIGGTDFSTHTYSYDDGSVDPLLSNFTLADEDFMYKIPLIQQALKMSSKKLHLTSSCWSPPTWMKTSKKFGGIGFLEREYYDVYAQYLLRFLDEYKKYNITFWGISTGNEPINGIVPIEKFNSLGWWPWTFADWIANHFGPQLKNSSHSDTLILGFEDQRILLPFEVDLLVKSNKNVLKYIDGFAVHWYLDFLVGVGVIKDLHKQFPEKFILYTEASEGADPWQTSTDPGSWRRGQNYLSSIIENTNNWVTGWLDWNLALNLEGGPNWAKNNVDSPILVNATADEFYKQPMFYAMGHVSKFIERGAVRVEMSPADKSGVRAMAVLNSGGRVIVVMLNENSEEKNVSINIEERGWLDFQLPAYSFSTFLC